MHTFTINGDEYLPHNNSLFRIGEEIETIEALEENQFYLHEDMVGTFELKDGSISYSAFDAVFRPQEHPDYNEHYTIGDTGNLGDDFTAARRLERLVPDQLAECPNCGAAAGDKEDEDSPSCFSCGYGTEGGLYEEREEQVA